MKKIKKIDAMHGSTIIEYLVVLVFGLIVVWQTAGMVMENLIEGQDDYVHSMAKPTT